MVNQDQYIIFQRNRQKLIDLMSRCQNVSKKLKIETWNENLSQLVYKVKSDNFKVMVLGEFKRGKSTVINALLGKDVLPAYATPTTAIINEIKWSEEKRAILHFRNPLPEDFNQNIHEKAMDHIQKSGSKNISPMEIAIEELEAYIVIPDPAKEQAKSVAETPYEKVELFWPLEFCKNGVEIIDSPGLNEDEIRAKITKDYLPKADAVLFVISSTAPVSRSEMTIIDMNIHEAGHYYIFFIFNRFDEIQLKERNRTMNFCQEKLTNKTQFGTEGIFFISAFKALQGRLGNNNSMIEESGILKLEESLMNFLTNYRGKIKILQPARQLTDVIKNIRNDIIPGQINLLDKSLDELENKYNQMKPLLDEAERYKTQVIDEMNLHRKYLSKDVKEEAQKKLKEISYKIQEWIDDIEIKTPIKLISFNHTEQVEALVNEIIDKTKNRIEEELYDWKKNSIHPMINKNLEIMMSNINVSVENFYAKIDQINADFTGIDIKREKEVGMNRFTTALRGARALLGDVFSGPNNAILGYKGFLSSIVTQVGIAVFIIGILGVTNPIVILGSIFVGSLFSGCVEKKLLIDQAKKELGKKIHDQFEKDIYPTADKIVENVDRQTYELLVKPAENHFEQEIKVIYEQLKAVLDDKKAGEEQVTAKKILLVELVKEITSIDDELQNLVFEVAAYNTH